MICLSFTILCLYLVSLMLQWLHRIAPRCLNSFTSSVFTSSKNGLGLSVVHTCVPLSETIALLMSTCTYLHLSPFMHYIKTSSISCNLLTLLATLCPLWTVLFPGSVACRYISLACVHIPYCLSSHSCCYLCISWTTLVMSQPLPRPHASLKIYWF